MPILITAGATREPIDAVRYVSNFSTGKTGAALADAFSALGFHTVLLRGIESAAPQHNVEQEIFSSAHDLAQRLRTRLASGIFEAVIMSAAVADYRPDSFRSDKINSNADELLLRLVRNPKILPQLKKWSPRPLTVIGFKLTVGADPAARLAAVKAQQEACDVDATVHNDLAEIRSSSIHPFHIFLNGSDTPKNVNGLNPLVSALQEILAADKKS